MTLKEMYDKIGDLIKNEDAGEAYLVIYTDEYSLSVTDLMCYRPHEKVDYVEICWEANY